MDRVEFTLHNSLTAWQFGPFQLAVIVAVVALAAWYLQADWKLAARGRRWSRKRTAAFLSGLVVVDLALQSPIAGYTGTYFQAHIVQHLLLMVVGPPLLALGAPSTLLLQTAARPTKERWLRILNSKPFAVISHPLSAWVLYYGAMYMFFLTPIVGYSMNHMALMDLINLGFLGGATLFWWPTIGVDPVPHWKLGYGARMLNLFIGVPVETWLGVALMNESRLAAHVDAPMYSLASVHSGGSLLWMFSELASAGAILPIFIQWMRSEDRKAARADAALDAEEAALATSLAEQSYDDLDGVMSRWEASLRAPVEPPWQVAQPVVEADMQSRRVPEVGDR
ncbi:MAG: integral rane protein [Acidimicrobiaceae bacterium]|nr:integral rane protein [Acidimicrobiaceae bacterium]